MSNKVTIKSGFFSSVNGDRKYFLTDVTRLVGGVVSDGVFDNPEEKFRVYADPDTKQIMVAQGLGWFNGIWVYNDSIIPIIPDSADNIYPRIDTIVIEIDKTVSGREASIKYIKGTPATDPVPTDLVSDGAVYQYPIAYIKRKANNNTITASDIEYLVGKSYGTPMVSVAVSTSHINANDIFTIFKDDPVMHKNVFRGQNLGSSLSKEQRRQILTGKFDNLYIGDYWERGGIKWRIADMNYFEPNDVLDPAPNGDHGPTPNHLVIVPDVSIGTSAFKTNLSEGNTIMDKGYYGSDISDRVTNIVQDTATNVFGPGHICEIQTIVSSGYYEAASPYTYASVRGKYHMKGLIMSEHMVFGGKQWGIVEGTRLTTQLALFRLNRDFIRCGESYWLRDMAGKSSISTVNWSGFAEYASADGILGVRPCLVVKGSSL